MAEVETLKDLLLHSAEKFPDETAFQIKRGRAYAKFSFAHVLRSVSNLSAHLKENGVGKGDRVAILSENRPEWGISYFAIASMGAVCVPIDAKLTIEEIRLLLDDSGAKAVVVSLELRNACGNSIKTIVMEEIEKMRSGVMPEANVRPDDLAAIIYTSGTTGSAKGVMLSHQNLISNMLATVRLFALGPKDNFLSVLPLHHTFEATAGFLSPFCLGVTITYAESLKSYVLLANMQETGVTVMCGVPLLYNLFAQGITREVEEKGPAAKILFSSLLKMAEAVPVQAFRRKLFSMIHKKFGGKIRFFVSGGAAIDPEILKKFELFGITILQGYGLTESSPILACCTLENNRLGSVGKPLYNIEIKIAQQGEIIARGPSIMQGYYKRPDLTAEVLKEGWLYTGDVGRIDKDGYVYITGRIKDVIVTGSGVNVYPDEIEFFLNKIPGIKESCVLGVKIKEGVRKGMEEVWAVVVPDHEHFGESDAAVFIRGEIAKLNQRLTEYKRIANVIIREIELPKTTTKKVRRFQLRKEEGL